LTQIAGDRNRLYGFALLSVGDSGRARATVTTLLSGSPAERANGLRSLALLDAYYGRYGRAVAWLEQAIALNRDDGAWVSELRNRLHLAGMHRTAGNAEAARAQLNRALAILQGAPRMPLTWLGFTGQHLARSGMVAQAESVLAVMEGRAPLRNADDSAFVRLVRGEIAAARGEPGAAVAALDSASGLEPRNYMRQGLARAYAAGGSMAEAVTVYDAMLRDSALGDEAQEPWVLAHFELAQIYDALGDSAAALPLYRRFAQQWRGGDADLPVLQQIRRRLRATP